MRQDEIRESNEKRRLDLEERCLHLEAQKLQNEEKRHNADAQERTALLHLLSQFGALFENNRSTERK